MTLPHSSVFRMLDEIFATTYFTTISIHEWTKQPSAITWLVRKVTDVRVRSLIFMTPACARQMLISAVRTVAKQL